MSGLRALWRTEQRPDLILAALAVSAYFGYYALHDTWQRLWLYYAATGALVFALAWWWRPAAVLGAVARVWVLVESGQQAVCGSATLAAGAAMPDGRDVCVQYVGEDFYRAALAITLAALIVGVTTWQSRRRP